eukprot:m.437996 g.437996  ORF g.437996 m.437996 type:complete len:66 (+) comp18181_c0_seq1:4119-4316(+)
MRQDGTAALPPSSGRGPPARISAMRGVTGGTHSHLDTNSVHRFTLSASILSIFCSASTQNVVSEN